MSSPLAGTATDLGSGSRRLALQKQDFDVVGWNTMLRALRGNAFLFSMVWCGKAHTVRWSLPRNKAAQRGTGLRCAVVSCSCRKHDWRSVIAGGRSHSPLEACFLVNDSKFAMEGLMCKAALAKSIVGPTLQQRRRGPTVRMQAQAHLAAKWTFYGRR